MKKSSIMNVGSEVHPTDGLTSWVEFDREAYLGNVRFFCSLVAPAKVWVVLKSNAYGHGWNLAADAAVAAGAEGFCVYALEEALALREAGFRQEILVLGYVPTPRLAEAVDADLILALFDRETLEALLAVGTATAPGRVHLKLETGTYRHGFDAAELRAALDRLHNRPEIVIEGAYTHFANIEDTTDHRYAEAQLARFDEHVAAIRDVGLEIPVLHTASTAAALVVPKTRLDMVRLGIGQFGFWPSRETLLSFRGRHGSVGDDQLRPVLTWKTRVAQVKDVPRGAFIGYGCTFQATREMRIAVLPVGYGDGYDRRLSNCAHVLIRGQRAPVRGMVCMNLIMADVTDIVGVSREDEVVLLGRQGEQAVSAEALASWIGTIHYEVTTRIGTHVPRRSV